ncbi:IclR family transcriptional regulator [Oceanobacillus sp. HCA-5259]|uniref:IclR family transcriptional regulator n=1 Tax=Oceanobacillus sp. HCA-5259 TaxID=3134661 RepID=UPI0030BEDFE5
MKINKTASRVLDILSLFAADNEPISVSRISEALKAPKSSTYEILETMVAKEFLEFDPNIKKYKLGIKLFEVGTSYLSNTDLIKDTRPYLENLVKRTGETAFLAVPSGEEIVYLDKVEGSSSIRTTASLGTRLPMYLTGLGKAILAANSDEKITEITKDMKYSPVNENSIKDFNSLMKNIRQTRERGYAIDDREREEDVYCIAAPICDYSNQPIAAISVAGLVTRMQEENAKEYSVYLINYAMELSRRFGYKESKLYFLYAN